MAVLGAVLLGWVAPVQALPDGLAAERFVDGLMSPVAMAVASDGDVLVTERGGAVRLVRDGELQESPVAEFAPVVTEEGGLLGIDVFQDYDATGRFAVIYTPASDPTRIYISRARVTDDGGGEVLEDPWIVLPGDPETDRHYGGDVHIAGEQMYVSLGDLTDHRAAQDTSRLTGKILRYNVDASIPQDNPLDSPVFASGFRNPFGLDVDADGVLWTVDNGGDRHEEVNRVVRGGNYGWPLALGRCDGYPVTEVCDRSSHYDPYYEFRRRTGVSGVAIYDRDMMPQLRRDIFVGGRHSAEIHRFSRTADDRQLMRKQPFFVLGSPQDAGGEGAIRDVEIAHDGAIYALVSDTPDGSILRIVPLAKVLDREAIVEEGARRSLEEAAGCAVVAVGAATPWTSAGLLVVCLMLFCWALRRREAPRGIVAGACVLAVLTLWSAKAGAQEFRFGAKAGANMATVTGDSVVTADLAPGLTGGIAARLELGEHFAISPELFYAMKGTGVEMVDERHISHHLTLPVFAEGMYDFGWIEPRLSLGPAATVVLYARNGDMVVTDQLNAIGFAAIAGVGADFGVGSNVVTVDLRYERGLSQIYEDAMTPEYVDTPENYNNVAYLLVGYLF